VTNSELGVADTAADRSAIPPHIDYDALVEKGAGLVHDGHVTVEELEIPSRTTEKHTDPGFTAQKLREDVQSFLDEHAPQPELETEDDDEEAERPVTAGVDWQALWEEFGFGTPGPLGQYFANPLQLSLALEVSDQARGNPEDLIERAVEKEILVKVTAEGAKGESPVRGYGLQRGGGA